MENISLVIVSDDTEYGEALRQALLHLCGRVLVQNLSKSEFFSEKREYDSGKEGFCFIESADLILWDGKEAEGAYGGRIVLLTDDPGKAVKDFHDSRFSIYKFSHAQTIAASLFEISGFLSGGKKVREKRRKVNLLAFSSCSGGCGCTVLSMAVAQELCRFRGKRSIYLSFEEIESTGEYLENPPGVKGVGVYLYHLFKESMSAGFCGPEEGNLPVVESYVIKDDFGMEAFAPTGGGNPLRNLTSEELGIFISSLADSGRYDVIIMDLGNCVSGISTACMEMAEKICFVTKEDCGPLRENQYLQHIICCCEENILDKLIKVRNMSTGREEYGMSVREDPFMLDSQLTVVRSSTFMQSGEVRKIILDGGFGQNVKLLTEKLVS